MKHDEQTRLHNYEFTLNNVWKQCIKLAVRRSDAFFPHVFIFICKPYTRVYPKLSGLSL